MLLKLNQVTIMYTERIYLLGNRNLQENSNKKLKSRCIPLGRALNLKQSINLL